MFFGARFLEATTKKRSLVPLFLILFQRTCTKITFSFVSLSSHASRSFAVVYMLHDTIPRSAEHTRQNLL